MNTTKVHHVGFILVAITLIVSAAAMHTASAQVAEEELLRGLTLRSIGPAVMGGRIDAIAVNKERPWIFYVGTASGGLWKTTNKGTTWTPVFDDQGTASIGAVAVAPSDPEIVWIGTGEANNRQSSTFGDGVYKSVDGGATWQHVGLRDTHHIGRILVDPRDPSVVYIAAVGHLWGPNEERGLFKTTDGGRTWSKVLYINEDTGVTDIAMDPANPQVIYAATYQRRRTAFGFNGGGPGSGLYKTTDGGHTWKTVRRGLPQGDLGRIGLDVSATDSRIVYATVQHREGGIFRSEDRGESWNKINDLNPRPMYYSQIRIDPSDPKRIYVLGTGLYVSDDGGQNFQENTAMTPTYDVGVHGDHHELWIDPSNGKHLILGGDGGLYYSWDGSQTWDKVNNIPLAQFYSVGVDMQKPYFVYGGAQDTHSWGGPSATRNHIGILNSDWFQINFGDGMYQRIDPTDPNTVYTESQGGNIVRFDRRYGGRKSIRPEPQEGESEYRFHWTSPIEISPHDPRKIYLGGDRLFISPDRGENWSATIDLTLGGDRSGLPIMGVVPDENTLSRHDGVSDWGTITTIAESPLVAGLLYVGTDDGLVQQSLDGGKTWTSMAGRFPGFDESQATVSRVLASHASAQRAYAAFDRHQLDDFAPYVFTTDDQGRTWRSITGDLPRVGWINVIAEHAKNPDLLFAGTETGLLVTLNRGQNWIPLKGNFPTVPVDDLVIHPRDNDLVVATHGRSFYILDDITPLVQLTSAVRSTRVHLFDLRPAVQFLAWKNESYGAQRQFVGTNPPDGAIVTYFLSPSADGVASCANIALTIRNTAGGLLRGMSGSSHVGMNRVVWDLRSNPPEGLPSVRGPLVPPGGYTVQIEACGQTVSRPLEVEMDPRVEVTRQELERRYAFLTELNTLRTEAERVFQVTTQIERDVQGFLDRAGAQRIPESLKSAAQAVVREAGRAGSQAGGRGGRGGGRGNIRSSAGRLFGELDGNAVQQGTFSGPTETQQGQLASLRRRLEEQTRVVNRLIEQGLPDLNRQINATGLSWIPVPTPLGRIP